MSPAWLSALVRARQAQEDVAQYELASAERRARAAQATARRANARIDELCAVTGEAGEFTVPAFTAATAALQSAAASFALARFAAEQAELGAEHRMDALRRAVVDRGAAEHLHEQAEEVERRAAERATQRDNDETAARVHRDRTRQASS